MKSIFSIFALIALLSTSICAEFVDVGPNHWAKGSVDRIQALGITNGYPDQTFRGDKSLTRYELAVYLSNYDRKVQIELQELRAQCASLNAALTQQKKPLITKP